jgi:hypothetical protein
MLSNAREEHADDADGRRYSMLNRRWCCNGDGESGFLEHNESMDK